MTKSALLTLPAALLAVLILAGCEPKVIPGTQIKDTPETRSLASLVNEKYRRAMENRDAETIVGMASPRFHESSGNGDAKDDYNYDGLKKRIADKFKRLKALTLEIVLIDIDVAEDGQKAGVKYHYFMKYLVQYPNEERWEAQSEDAQMHFALENGEWKVTSGL